MKRPLLCLLLITASSTNAPAAPDDICLAPSCAELKLDAAVAKYEEYIFTTKLGPTGYFRANVSITEIKSDPRWWPFCYLSVNSKGDSDSQDSIQVSLFKHPERQIEIAIRTIRRGKVVKQDKFPGKFSIGTAVPMGISWKPREFEIAFGNQRKTYKAAFTPVFAHLACSSASGMFEGIETRYDTKADACDQALTLLSNRQKQDFAKNEALTAAYRKQRSSVSRQEAQKLHCDLDAIAIKDKKETLEIFKDALRLCTSDRIVTGCDLNCRTESLQGAIKAANEICGEFISPGSPK
jgi:hypothetical protein